MTRQQIWQAGYFDGLAGDPPQPSRYPGKEDSYQNGYDRGWNARMETSEASRERPSRRTNPGAKAEPFTVKHLRRLIGRKVVAVAHDGNPDDYRETVFGLQFDDGSIGWILRDPEGNGPGWMDIQ